MTAIERDLSARQAARLLGIRDERMRELLASGAVPTACRPNPNGRWRVAPSGLARYIEERGK